MKTKIRKWGNSLAVRLPKPLADQLKINSGSPVEITVEGETLTIKPMVSRYRLNDLVSQIKPENRHEEVDWGKPEGEETW